jgi:hypothetical protein
LLRNANVSTWGAIGIVRIPVGVPQAAGHVSSDWIASVIGLIPVVVDPNADEDSPKTVGMVQFEVPSANLLLSPQISIQKLFAKPKIIRPHLSKIAESRLNLSALSVL